MYAKSIAIMTAHLYLRIVMMTIAIAMMPAYSYIEMMSGLVWCLHGIWHHTLCFSWLI